MSDFTTPALFQDAADLLSADGFATSTTWYHGTSSGLVDSISSNGLIGGGDRELLAKMQGTLRTISAPELTSNDPVFLTQSKELAYYWAAQKVRTRNLYFSQDETPVVFEIKLSDADNEKVRPDVGGAAMLLEPGNAFVEYLTDLYQQNSQTLAAVDNPLKLGRSIYLNNYGLAYASEGIHPSVLTLISE